MSESWKEYWDREIAPHRAKYEGGRRLSSVSEMRLAEQAEWRKIVRELEAENERLREALAYYADPDRCAVARIALRVDDNSAR